MYSWNTPSIDAFITGPRYSQKKPTTSASRMAAIDNMIATSLVNTDWRRCTSRAGSFIAASDKLIADSADGPNESRLLRIVAELLTQPADEHINRAIVGFEVESVRLVQDAIATERPSAMTHEQAE